MTTAHSLTGPIQSEDLPDGRFKILKPMVIDLGVQIKELHEWAMGREEELGIDLSDSGTTLIMVPEGFDTDFSSIPILAQLITGDKDKYRVAGLVHDFLYREGAPRGSSDRVWRIIARSGSPSVGAFRGYLGWLGLRLGGFWAYNQRKKQREQQG